MTEAVHPPEQSFDVVITGAGIAGVALAIKLHQAGLSVCLIGVPRRYNAIEGMAERARRGLEAVGCRHALAAIGPKVLRTASWSGEPFDGNHEYLVERCVFDQGLWQDAEAAGTPVLNSRVLRVELINGDWHCEHEGGQVIASYWVEARGRAAPRSAKQQRAPSTVAIAGWWQSVVGDPIAGVHTFARGWVWYARLADGRLSAQIFLDAQDVPSKSTLVPFYLAQLADSEALAPVLATAELIDEPTARGASLTLSEPLISNRCARVGDAALALDPLAGHGQFEAVGSALALASCINTLLQNPEHASAAIRFYEERMRGDYVAMARNGRDFYAMEKRHAQHQFWSARNGWPDSEPSHPPPQHGVGAIELRPVSVDGLITERYVVVCPDQPRGVWQIDGVPLLPLLHCVRRFGKLNPEHLSEFCAPLQWPELSVGRAVHWLGARGLLSLKLPEGGQVKQNISG